MSTPFLDRVRSALPIFPLPRVVLLPRDQLPLHVFEPRYRDLVAHVRADHGLMGVATLLPAAGEPPPVHALLGIGRVVGFEPLPDGRSHIVLRYVARARIVDELEVSTPFRQVCVELVPDDGDDAEAAVRSLRRLLVQLLPMLGDGAAEAQRITALDGRAFVDELARRVLLDADLRLACLEATRVADRVRLVESVLAGWLTRAAPAADA